MMKVVLFLGLVFLVLFAGSDALSCYCDLNSGCTPVETLKKTCKGGLTFGVCGCCQVCAKVEGESCDGLWGFSGTCDVGLVCDKGSEPLYETIGKCIKKNVEV